MDIPIIILSIVEDRTRGFRWGLTGISPSRSTRRRLFREVGSLLEQGRSNKRVLVVDEDASALKVLSDVLKDRGYSVTEANGADLVAKAVAIQPDIILLNAQLSKNAEIVRMLRFEKGLENVLFLVYQ